MNLKIGIVGLANVGKSTLFNALLKKQVAFAANYPFATIEPNIGVVPVPDDRLAKLAEITKEEEKLDKLPPLVPAVVEFVDIAGLVKGASEGQGLGNKFLAHIREVDIICHVIRFFEDSSIIHVEGVPDPARDREIVETELILADLQTLNKQKDLYGDLKAALNSGKIAKDVVTDPDEVRDLQLLTMKPVMYVANVSEKQLIEGVIPANAGINNGIPDQVGNDMIRICAETESQLAGLSSGEQKEYLASLGLEFSGLDRLIKKAYESLGLISFLTCGPIEARAWTIENGTKAPRAAGVIHTDFEKKFIKADVVSFGDFKGWKVARETGKVRSEGKEYVMRDGDVVEFKVGS